LKATEVIHFSLEELSLIDLEKIDRAYFINILDVLIELSKIIKPE